MVEETKSKLGCYITLAVIALLVIICFIVYASKYNNLVVKNESANAGKSQFASAINNCSQKMKAVWTLADQEGLLEKETYLGVAKARSGLSSAEEEFDKAKQEKSSSIFDLTKLAVNYGQAVVNVRVAFEAYPNLRTTETYQKAMTAVQEGYNEIKTALDDWIILVKSYNSDRKGLVTNFFCSAFGWDFPESIAYYDGGIKAPEQFKLDANELNPRSK
jgi:hypothetical protein